MASPKPQPSNSILWLCKQSKSYSDLLVPPALSRHNPWGSEPIRAFQCASVLVRYLHGLLSLQQTERAATTAQSSGAPLNFVLETEAPWNVNCKCSLRQATRKISRLAAPETAADRGTAYRSSGQHLFRYRQCRSVSPRCIASCPRRRKRYVQMLKTNGAARAGLFEREEIESTVSNNVPDPRSLPADSLAAGGMDKLMRDADFTGRLKPVFVTDVGRSTYSLRLPRGDEIELALDEGVIKAGDATTPVQEVEMELKRGESDHLYQLALDLLDSVPLRMSHASKGSRGYALIVQEHSEPVRGQPLRLKRGDTVERAFRQIAENCLAQIHGNEHGVVSGHDPSSVHQMRVGLRRLRSAFDPFEDVIPAASTFSEEVRWIAGELGAARDWEVIADSTLPAAFGSAPDDANAEAVTHAAKDIARQNRARVAEAVDSARYTRLMIELTRWLERSGWREGVDADGLERWTSGLHDSRAAYYASATTNCSSADANCRIRSRTVNSVRVSRQRNYGTRRNFLPACIRSTLCANIRLPCRRSWMMSYLAILTYRNVYCCTPSFLRANANNYKQAPREISAGRSALGPLGDVRAVRKRSINDD
jgi:inorganic triphosphatase YgiF